MKSSFWEFPKIESYSRIKAQNQTRFVIAQFLAIVQFKPSQHRLKFTTEEAAWIQAAGDGTAGRPLAKNWLKSPIFFIPVWIENFSKQSKFPFFKNKLGFWTFIPLHDFSKSTRTQNTITCEQIQKELE